MKKTFFKWAIKAFIAGVGAFLLLNAFAMLWYNVPVHYDNPTGATEYVWESHKFYSKGTEGFALGRTNNEGFNNTLDYFEGEHIDILLMGSSHMEGFNVAQDENAGAQINRLFEGEKYCYNIGTAGHTMLYCIKNLDDALSRYTPEEYVVVETFSLDFESRLLRDVAESRLADIPSHTGGIVGLMQKLPYLRLFYTQHFKGGGEAFGGEEAATVEEGAGDYRSDMGAVLDMVAKSAAEHSVTPIIVYNNSLLINEDGSVYTATDSEKLGIFSQLCEERGILFADATVRFIEHYEAERALPYGFSNTSPGGGHMNRVGHRLFAEEVHAVITEREG